MEIKKTATLELTNEDVAALRAIATIAVLEVERMHAGSTKCAYERPGISLGFDETTRAYELAKRLRAQL